VNFGQSNFSYSLQGRLDKYTEINQNPISYFAGVEWKNILSKVDLRFNNSRNFRVPSFNEMYYLNYGNSDLKPEIANSTEFGVQYKPINSLQGSVNVFYNVIKDKIVSIPKNPLMWTAENFGLVEIPGINLSIGISPIMDNFEIYVDYTYQKPIEKSKKSVNFGKLLPYTSEEKIATSLKTKFNNFQFNSDFSYNSFVYTLPDNSINSVLPAFYDLNCEIAYSIHFKKSEISFSLQVQNILNKYNYSIINYPLPGRNFIINLIYKLK
jgi:outer membrane cobalamin receptor